MLGAGWIAGAAVVVLVATRRRRRPLAVRQRLKPQQRLRAHAAGLAAPDP